MGVVMAQPILPIVQEFTVNTSQSAGTYTVCTATGDILIEKFAVYVKTAGAGLVSLSLQTNDTTPFSLLTGTEGLLANLGLGANLNPANKDKSFFVANGKQITATIVGTGTGGSVVLCLVYFPVQLGNILS